ncbi:MAG: helix-turn-helix domain-containing protein [Christensenellaceae bacterium]|nr:helix-turn-helix domain-containing protein [Christensenellaceae bacterium]
MPIDSLLSSLGNPLRAKLLLEIHARGQATAKQLGERFYDIPQPTLYRHLKRMHEEGVLRVAGERRVRGTLEKAYALQDDLEAGVQEMLQKNDGELYLRLFTQYMLGVAAEFQEYAARPGIDILRDGSGFTLAPVYATTEELTKTLTQIGALLQPLLANEPGGERRLHNLCIITTPPKAKPNEKE